MDECKPLATGPLRVAALHSLATLTGAGTSEGRPFPELTPVAPYDPIGTVSLSHGAVSPAAAAAEAAIRDAVFTAAAAVQGSTPAERIWTLLQKGGDSFLELRVAAYRLVAALGRAAQVDSIDTRVESAYDISTSIYNIMDCFQRLHSIPSCAATAWAPRVVRRRGRVVQVDSIKILIECAYGFGA